MKHRIIARLTTLAVGSVMACTAGLASAAVATLNPVKDNTIRH